MTKYLYIGFVGSRKLHSERVHRKIAEYLDWAINSYGKKDITIVSGGARGIDTITINMAKKRRIRTLVYLPKYDEYRTKYNKIYFERNQRIVDRCTILIAFPYNYSKGTMNTVKLFKAKRGGGNLHIYNFTELD